MNLAPEQIERFYRIWWPLLEYVNEKRGVSKAFPRQRKKGKVQPKTAVAVRDVLWADQSLLESFIEENPASLSDDDLKIAASWHHRVAGGFLVMRHLKKYSVFLDDSTRHAYGVCGLVSEIEEITGPDLPVMVNTVLLPFEDKIIYDSLIGFYSIYFGRGISEDFEVACRNIEEREGVITSLPPLGSTDAEARRQFISERNKKLLAALRKELFKSGLSPKIVERDVENVEMFGGHLLAQDPPRLLVEIKAVYVKSFLDGLRDKERKATATSLKRLARFLYETMRIKPKAMWDIRQLLKMYEPARGKRMSRR